MCIRDSGYPIRQTPQVTVGIVSRVRALGSLHPAFRAVQTDAGVGGGNRGGPLLDIDGRLITGAVLFGLGWGLAGYCPGPAVAALASGAEEPVFFLVALLGGSLAGGSWFEARR